MVTLFLAMIATAAMHAAAATAPQCAYENGYDYFVQGQGATFTNVPSAAKCCELVNGGLFTYQTQTKSCYAKNSTAGREINSACISGGGNVPPAKGCAFDSGYDYFVQGQAATWSNVASAEACCALCAAASDCPYFTYQTKTKDCYLKADAAGRRSDSACVSGRNTAYTAPPVCEGEFALSNAGACCTMNGECGSCKRGEYLCPSDQKTCVASAADYDKCPGLKGTHLDWTLSEDARLDYLVAHTSLAEQIGQLTNKAPAIYELGIPQYNWLNDDQHGVARTSARATVFPNGAGLGATFSHKTIHAVGTVIGQEARGLHDGFLSAPNGRGATIGCNGCGITLYAPNINLVRDPRWGRAQEVMGEDPTLTGDLVAQFVTGAQNNTLESPVGPDGHHLRVGTCCKHFAAYDVEGGAGTPARYMFDAELNARDLWETYMPAFESCVRDAQSSHVMCSYNSVEGVPTCGNKGLLTTILRDQWKWDGFVVSDYDAWANILNTHHYVSTMEDAAAEGLNAGMDQEGGGTGAISQLAAAVKDGKTTAAAVANAFKRLFRLRIRLGMLDPPTSVPYNKLRYNATELEFNQAHLAVAKTAALESMTLLKNAGTLPLAASKLKKLAVIGPQATMAGLLFGNYAGSANKGNWGRTIEQGLADYLSAHGGATVVQSNGCDDIACGKSSDNYADASKAAASSDATVVVLGLAFDNYCNTGFDGDGKQDYCEREGQDRAMIELPEGQAKMVAALRAAMGPDKPLIAVLIHGGTMALGDAVTGALDAVLDAWYPAIEGANAIAETLFGDYSPAGRSPATWYPGTSSLPPLGDMNMYPNATAKTNGITYRFFQGNVTYPFGFGLSYTDFAYSGAALDKASYKPCDAIGVTVTVRNTGAVDSDEVVQVYVATPKATVPSPQIRLAAFTRVHIEAGSTATVSLSVAPRRHAVVHDGDVRGTAIYAASANQFVETGPLEIYVGGGQPKFYAGNQKLVATIDGTAALLSCSTSSGD